MSIGLKLEGNNTMFKHTAKGTIEVVFQGIPGVLFISKSIVTGKKGRGKVYTLHITPFIGIGLIIPSFLLRKRNTDLLW